MTTRRRLRIERLEARHLLTAVDVPDDLTGAAPGQVDVPVNIDTAAGIRGAEIRLSYDTSLLEITDEDVTSGSVWSSVGGTDLVVNRNDVTGEIIVSVFAAETLPSVGGSLVQLQFTVKPGATVGSTTVIDLRSVRLNEGAITLDPTPQLGPDPTDGLITILGSAPQAASVSGTVFVDANNNNQVDPTEGLADVAIILVSTTTNEQRVATTQADGRYEFLDVTPGSYRIRQRQPAAYLDGGVNEIEIVLTSDQQLDGQNFRERGLRPEYVFNRLFTTTVMPVGSDPWSTAIRRIQVIAEAATSQATSIAAAASATAEGERTADVPAAHVAAPVASSTSAVSDAPGAPSDNTPDTTLSATREFEFAAHVLAEGEYAVDAILVAPDSAPVPDDCLTVASATEFLDPTNRILMSLLDSGEGSQSEQENDGPAWQRGLLDGIWSDVAEASTTRDGTTRDGTTRDADTGLGPIAVDGGDSVQQPWECDLTAAIDAVMGFPDE